MNQQICQEIMYIRYKQFYYITHRNHHLEIGCEKFCPSPTHLNVEEYNNFMNIFVGQKKINVAPTHFHAATIRKTKATTRKEMHQCEDRTKQNKIELEYHFGLHYNL